MKVQVGAGHHGSAFDARQSGCRGAGLDTARSASRLPSVELGELRFRVLEADLGAVVRVD